MRRLRRESDSHVFTLLDDALLLPKCQKKHWKEHSEYCTKSPTYLKMKEVNDLKEKIEEEEKTSGKDDEKVFSLVNDLGGLLWQQGKLKEAEAIHRRALKGEERTLGVDHPRTLTSCSNLGFLFE